MTEDDPSFFTVAASSIAAPGSDGSRDVEILGTCRNVPRPIWVRLRTSDAGASRGISYWWTIGSGCPDWWICTCANARHEPPTI